VYVYFTGPLKEEGSLSSVTRVLNKYLLYIVKAYEDHGR
jgi:hypothetical protein